MTLYCWDSSLMMVVAWIDLSTEQRVERLKQLVKIVAASQQFEKRSSSDSQQRVSIVVLIVCSELAVPACMKSVVTSACIVAILLTAGTGL